LPIDEDTGWRTQPFHSTGQACFKVQIMNSPNCCCSDT
jgi:hypothetical protein